MSESEKRDPNGRLPNGRFAQGNKGGGRKAIPPEVREILEAATIKAAHTLVAGLDAMSYTMSGESVPNWKERREYLCALYDRLYGKPVQAIAGDDESPLFPNTDTANAAALEISRRLMEVMTKAK